MDSACGNADAVPPSFPGGDDSLANFLRCVDSISGGAGDFPGCLLPTTSERAAWPQAPGHLDPVVFVRGNPELLSILVNPEEWLLPEPPPLDSLPRGFFFVQNYAELVREEVVSGFSYLFTDEMCHRHPEGFPLNL